MPSFRRNSHEVLRTWEDYLSMAKKLHMDVYDEIVYRTRKLRRRHDDLVLKCQEKDHPFYAETSQSFLAAQSDPSSGRCFLHSDGAHAPR